MKKGDVAVFCNIPFFRLESKNSHFYQCYHLIKYGN